MLQDRYPQIALSDDERVKYDNAARVFLLETVGQCAKFDPDKIDPQAWEYVRRRQGMSVYHSVNGTPDPNVLLMLGTGLVDGSLEDVMSGLYCDTTEDLRTAKVLLGYPLAGGAVMNASERRSAKDPYRFAGIKWCAAKSVWGLMLSSRRQRGRSCRRSVLGVEEDATRASGNSILAYIFGK